MDSDGLSHHQRSFTMSVQDLYTFLRNYQSALALLVGSQQENKFTKNIDEVCKVLSALMVLYGKHTSTMEVIDKLHDDAHELYCSNSQELDYREST
tara:strand:- start:1637 stop:1924 length:288 start_codon:yes stop_codon:yes gene_type:complete